MEHFYCTGYDVGCDLRSVWVRAANYQQARYVANALIDIVTKIQPAVEFH